MVLDRLKQVAQHVTGTAPPPHPFDPLSATEIEAAADLIRREHGSLYYNAISLLEPRKAEMQAWLADPEHTVRPHRVADVVAIGKGSKVYDGWVDLTEKKIVNWELTNDVQPLVCFVLRLLCTRLICSRFQWRISKSSSTLCERTSKSSSSVGSLAFQRTTCTKSTATVSTRQDAA